MRKPASNSLRPWQNGRRSPFQASIFASLFDVSRPPLNLLMACAAQKIRIRRKRLGGAFYFFDAARCTPSIESSASAKPSSDLPSMPCPRNSQPSANAHTGLSSPSDDTTAGGSRASPLRTCSKSVRGCGKRGLGRSAALQILAGPQGPSAVCALQSIPIRTFAPHGQTLNRF